MAKLRKKIEQNESFKVSKVPLPISDSSFIIDLPDGQKLLVGNITNGTVIEVATWRGTGRPDSRTTRLMLGMSNTQIDNDAEYNNLNEKKEVESTKSKMNKFLRVPLEFLKWLFNFKAKESSKSEDSKLLQDKNDNVKENEKKVQVNSKYKNLVTYFRNILFKKSKINFKNESNPEIEEWLNNLQKIKFDEYDFGKASKLKADKIEKIDSTKKKILPTNRKTTKKSQIRSKRVSKK